MATIKGISGMTPQEISFELNRGAKFMRYRYCFSILVLTVMRGTDITLSLLKTAALRKGLPWTVLALFRGMVGHPMGPIRSIQSLVINLRGGMTLRRQLRRQWDWRTWIPAAATAVASSSTK